MKTRTTGSAQISYHFSQTVSVPYSIAANFRLPIRSLQKGPCVTIKDISSSTSKTYPSWVEIQNCLPQILRTLGRVYCQNVKLALLRIKFHDTKNMKINFVPHREQWDFIALATCWMLYGVNNNWFLYELYEKKNIYTMYKKCRNFSVKRSWTYSNH